MILPKAKDAIHKAWLYRLLTALIDDSEIQKSIYFKGGTCATMLNFLDRFSVDLDFDLDKKAQKEQLRSSLHKLFKPLKLEIKNESQKALQFFLRYPSEVGERNTIKLEIIDVAINANQYAPQYLQEIDRYMNCQTIETMFSNKLAAVLDRFTKNKSIAGRDIYDIHYFFMRGFACNKEVIKERTGLKVKDYLNKLLDFIEKKITQTIIDQDLNTLLPKEKFDFIRKKLKSEVMMFIADEMKR